MNYRRLGRSGLQLSEFGLGSWVTFGGTVGAKEAKEFLALAYDNGVNFFDNAEGYEAGESERLMGEAIQSLGWSRDSYVVSSKVFWGGDKPNQKGLSRKHVFDACHAALQRLRVDYLDLYYCHRPDIDTPIEETVRAMHDLITQGKVMYWGTSEWSAQQITEAYGIAKANHWHLPIMEQPEYHLLKREKVEGEFNPVYDLTGLGLTTFSPLASGLLTGKYQNGLPEDSRLALPGYESLREMVIGDGSRLQQVAKLGDFALELGVPLHHLALNWCLSNPRVSSVILGASKRSQLEDNLKARESADLLTDEVMTKIDEIVQNKPEQPKRY